MELISKQAALEAVKGSIYAQNHIKEIPVIVREVERKKKQPENISGQISLFEEGARIHDKNL